MSEVGTILLVDDDSDALMSLSRALSVQSLGASIEASSSLEKAREIVAKRKPAVAVLDLSFDAAQGVESGFELLAYLRRELPSCRTIILTGHGSVEYGVRALELGASNFLEKPANIPHLSALIRDGLAQAHLYQQYEKLKVEKAGDNLESLFVGESAYSRTLREQLRYLAITSQPVLITGETGTGKGVCANALHRLSGRRGRLVRYQPGLGGSDLVGSELFGHVRGAFTGAEQERVGLVASSDNGTLFLDEVDELPATVQVALLGLLQEGKFRRLGESAEKEVRFRLIAATNADIEEALATKKLRSDLFHRIAHERIELLPLRKRKEDIEALAAHFLARTSERDGLNVYEIAKDASNVLLQHDWPGNVRELEAILEGACFRAHHRGDRVIQPEDLRLGRGKSEKLQEGQSFRDQVEAFKLQLVKEALERHSGNQVQAAKELELDRSSLRRILQRE